MATQYTAKIPFSRVIRIGVWSNQSAKTTMNNVYTQLQKKYPGKEVYITNGGFFNMTSAMTPCWGVKADGKVWGNEWSTTSFMAMNGKKIQFFNPQIAFPSGYSDGISGYPALIEDGKKSSRYHTAPDGTSNRGRTMLGYTKDSVVLSCISDCSGSSDFTLAEELNYMLNQGCTHAINLDGGGSSQCNFNGKTIKSSRKVNNFVYIIADVDKSNPKIQVQQWLNQTYDAGLVLDGSLGPASLKAIIKGMQKEIGTAADGSWGPKSQAAYTYSKMLKTPNMVKLIQCALCRKGYWNMELTGEYDIVMSNQVTLYQRANKLGADGKGGPATVKSLFK